jgi:hypothetical protein
MSTLFYIDCNNVVVAVRVCQEGPVNDGFHSKERMLNFSIAGPSSEQMFQTLPENLRPTCRQYIFLQSKIIVFMYSEYPEHSALLF